jgi:hypothetical protein
MSDERIYRTAKILMYVILIISAILVLYTKKDEK